MKRNHQADVVIQGRSARDDISGGYRVELIWPASAQMGQNASSRSASCFPSSTPCCILRFHPSLTPKRPPAEAYVNPPVPDPTKAGPPPQLPAGYGRWREYRYDPNAMIYPAPASIEGGSLSGWRAGGFLSGNARRAEQQQDDYGRGGGEIFGAQTARKGGTGGGAGGGWVKDLSTVLCFVSPAANDLGIALIEIEAMQSAWTFCQCLSEYGGTG